jgi:hypothetical protein
MRPVLPRQRDCLPDTNASGPVDRLGSGYPATHSENRLTSNNCLITGTTSQQTQ